MAKHELKTWSEYFQAVLNGSKTFEVRKNDRSFKVGDLLLLREWDNIEYTGDTALFKITYILQGGNFGIEAGYCVLGIQKHGW